MRIRTLGQQPSCRNGRTFYITAKDKDNNASTFNIPIVISADMPPFPSLVDSLVYTDTATHLSNNAFNNIVQKSMLAGKSVTNVVRRRFEYRGNEDKPVTYNISYSYTELTDSESTSRTEGWMATRGAEILMFSFVVTGGGVWRRGTDYLAGANSSRPSRTSSVKSVNSSRSLEIGSEGFSRSSSS